ncbi:MAG: hypothetical protein SFW09_19245 [Hyphomicrobiaceae bacterium]|nr:hypothetical protein [Hyphomicrobiaceae bacterium]
MSTSPFGEFRNGSGAHEPFEDKMQQIRELLFGEFKRDSDARLALIEARVRELEQGLHRKLDAIQARLDQMSGDVANERRQSFDDLARHVVELGERIGQISRS